ncbi:MAG: hypothetical protein JRH11_15450, partial [Deltaproteobacteria bacterium]|nr:hypothetical protein [Deltaproteobacteria bacterium]
DFARNTMLPAFSTPAAADRQYEWDCALLGDDCQPMLEDWSQNGRLVPTSWEEIGAEDLPRHQSWPYEALLPAPTDQATVFSWSATACTRGECGSYLSSSLLLSNRIINRDSFARSVGNDGVVTQVSAEFGIHMGNWSWDHLHWTRSKSGRLSRFKRWLTGQEQEPVENFYFYWLEWLGRSGY